MSHPDNPQYVKAYKHGLWQIGYDAAMSGDKCPTSPYPELDRAIRNGYEGALKDKAARAAAEERRRRPWWAGNS